MILQITLNKMLPCPLPLNLFHLLRYHGSLAHKLASVQPDAHLPFFAPLLPTCSMWQRKQNKKKTLLVDCGPEVHSCMILYSHSSSHSHQFKQQHPKLSQEIWLPSINNKDFLVLALCEGICKHATQRGLWLQLFCPFHFISYVNFPIYLLFLISFSVRLSCYPITFWCHQVYQEPTHLHSLQHLLCNTLEHLYTTQPLFQHNYFLTFFASHLPFFLIIFFWTVILQSWSVSALAI